MCLSCADESTDTSAHGNRKRKRPDSDNNDGLDGDTNNADAAESDKRKLVKTHHDPELELQPESNTQSNTADDVAETSKAEVETELQPNGGADNDATRTENGRVPESADQIMSAPSSSEAGVSPEPGVASSSLPSS